MGRGWREHAGHQPPALSEAGWRLEGCRAIRRAGPSRVLYPWRSHRGSTGRGEKSRPNVHSQKQLLHQRGLSCPYLHMAAAGTQQGDDDWGFRRRRSRTLGRSWVPGGASGLIWGQVGVGELGGWGMGHLVGGGGLGILRAADRLPRTRLQGSDRKRRSTRAPIEIASQ